VNGLDLFSGIGGITLALSPWVTPVAYCENDEYAQAVLIKNMVSGLLPKAPIWDDVRTLKGLPDIDIIYGGFPCQDISITGRGKGLEGERSRLFFEIIRLVRECKPSFVFLENVPAIRTRGLSTVIKAMADEGYDCRWTDLSASKVGANHKRNRWWLLAYSDGYNLEAQQRSILRSKKQESEQQKFRNVREDLSDFDFERLERQREESCGIKAEQRDTFNKNWWTVEPDVGRVAHGVSNRLGKLRCLGNAVVPLQAREAFMTLAGLRKEKVL